MLHASSRALCVAALALASLLPVGVSASAAAQASARTITGEYRVSDFRKPSDAELRQKLSAEQYKVTQHEGTERPFHNAYWDNHEAGLYVDVVSGEPLFS